MSARKIMVQQKIVRETSGEIHGPVQVGFDFVEDERRSALRAMISGLITVAECWNLLPYVFETMETTRKAMEK